MSRCRVVYLTPTFQSYRLPVFDELARIWPRNFRVIALANPGSVEERRAIAAGSFARTLVAGKWIALSRRHDEGRGTPTGVLLAPGVLPALVRLRPRIVIVNNFSLWTMCAMVARSWGARIVIFSEGTLHTERSVRSGRLALRRWLARRASAFVVNGRMAREYIEFLGVDSGRIVEGGMGLDVDGIRRASEDAPVAVVDSLRRELQLVHPTLLTVCRLVRGKGITYLLTALTMLKRDGIQASLVVVGDGPERRVLEEQCRRDGLSDVHFVGRVPAERVPIYHRLADLFVLPTLQDNWSLAVAEAMASGLPIITSVYNGLWPDLVKNGENGFVVTPENAAELAKCIGMFADTPRDKIDQMGERSRDLIMQYRPDRVAAAYVKAVTIATQ
jgi:glycosyltransferase involved in cell wall biosynthesis